MARLRLGRNGGKRDAPRGQKRERRRAAGRHRRGDRRRRNDRRDGRNIRDLYKTDLDRHLWSWASPSAKKERKKRRRSRARRRKIAGLLASAAGMLSAAGLSYLVYRKLRKGDRPEDLITDPAEHDEDDVIERASEPTPGAL